MFHYLIRRLTLLVITILILNLIAYGLHITQISDHISSMNFIDGFRLFLTNNLHGDLGTSSVSGMPVYDEIVNVFPATIELCVVALSLSMIIGIPLGTLAGIYSNHWVRNLIISLTMVGYSVPIFWLGSLFIVYFSLKLGWFPVSGRFDLLLDIPEVTGFGLVDALLMPIDERVNAFISVVNHLALPATVLAIITTTELIRQLASSTAEVMQENYIKAAATKGLSKCQIVMRHVLHNALPPIFPVLGLRFGNVMTMAMVTEIVFAWPGIGRWLINSINHQDYAAIQGGMLVLATFVILVNILTDIFSAMIHPLRRKELYE